MKILVIGATGMLGEPVARRLAADGHKVRVMSRKLDRAKGLFDPSVFESIEGDVEDQASLIRALDGCDGVHINIQGGVGGDWDLERRGAEATVRAIKARIDNGKSFHRITLISGASTDEKNAWFPGTRAKLGAEQAVRDSGLPFTIFRCTMFMELLSRMVKGDRALIMGEQVNPWRWVAAEDYAAMVSRAFVTPDAAGKILYVLGPEALTFEEAYNVYVPICAPDAKIIKAPFWLLWIVSWMPGNGMLRNVGLPIMKYFSKVKEGGDAAEANELLGAPTMTVESWSKAHMSID